MFNDYLCLDKEYIGPIISLVSVSKDDMGAYLCIAQNGVPPAVSRRTILQVKCKYKVLIVLNICRDCLEPIEVKLSELICQIFFYRSLI